TCQNCAAQAPKWMGRCSECGQWNTLVEETYKEPSQSAQTPSGSREALSQALPQNNRPLAIHEINIDEARRSTTRMGELDRVLGGGIVPGSLVLLGGDPGIGKSTILMQGLSATPEKPILYVSGEESANQIKLRGKRLGVDSKNFLVFAETRLEEIIEAAQKLRPGILIIDSIQTIFSTSVTSAPGSVSQVRECTGRLMLLAKTLEIATFVVGHVTKEGSIAGPKVLEHMVDTVLYFESSDHSAYRILRAIKNRFGSTNEIGVFEMAEGGLREVQNPSELFLQERTIDAPGTAIVSAVEGSRPILVELQTLVSQSTLAMPRRTTLGIDQNKVALLVAVIEKRLGVPLYGHDIFAKVAGGIKLDEPATDLGIAAALLSSFKNRALDAKLLICGEVGLTGEVRRISQLDLRLSEAAKLGFQRAIVPQSGLDALAKANFRAKIEVTGVRSLDEAVKALDL
ncbi:MAG TPA: DNA repair protein RadA, partial [Oligoflexia bacterium]|nr:DNA repair protein RadA [Oligoflexia bacterium]